MIWQAKRFHIELTNACTAKCPFCMRTEKKIQYSDQLYFSDIQKFFIPGLLKNIKDITLCGSFGDPIYARDFLQIVEFFNSHNIHVNIHTNGYNNTKNFWNVLGKFPRVEITFGVDGITQKTHESHRVGTVLKDILSNASEFNAAGGKSIWQFIVFEQNQHQMQGAQKIANYLGFKDIKFIPSRFYSEKLSQPTKYQGQDTKKISSTYECKYKKENNFYINAQGQFLPCCWLSHIEKTDITLIDKNINIKYNSFQEIQTKAQWVSKIGHFYYKDVGNMCIRKCGI